jgi:predicted deacylase
MRKPIRATCTMLMFAAVGLGQPNTAMPSAPTGMAAKASALVGAAAGPFPASPVLAPVQASDRATFTVGTAAAGRGSKGFGVITVPAGVDAALSIPVAVVHGARPGPVLALVSGSHGTEYASIVAVSRLVGLLDPSAIAGTVILVPLVNPPSFHRMVPHLNPVDGLNMNRRYPGRADSTQTERTSFQITQQVINQADYLIDMHGGDLDESLWPFSYWPKTGNEARDAASRNMVLAFGLDHIVIQEAPGRPRDPAEPSNLSAAVNARGKIAITVEAGHAGTTEPEDIRVLVDGTLSVMRHLKMLEGAPSPIASPVWIERIVAVASDADGLFYPLVGRGRFVERGMRLGYVTDYLGRTIAEARAPVAGVVIFVRAVPSLSKGETIAYVGPVLTGAAR